MKDRKHDLDQSKLELDAMKRQHRIDNIFSAIWIAIAISVAVVAICLLASNGNEIDKVSTLIAERLCK